MVDSRSGLNLLYLPLDKLMQQSGAATVADCRRANADRVAAATPTPTTDPRSRDGARTRDREVAEPEEPP